MPHSTDDAKNGEVTKARSEKTAIFRIMAGIGVPFMGAVSSISIEGEENVPRTGAFVVAPNHFSNIDPLVIGVAMYRIGRMPHYLAKASLFTIPFVGFLLKKSGQVPVERGGRSRSSDPMAGARVNAEQGNAIVIYPEGSLTRDPDLWPMRGKSGAVRTALEQGIPLIPSAHWGTQDLLGPYTSRIRFFPRSKIRVLFGPPVDLSEFRGRPLDSAVLTAATAVLMRDITTLVEKLRGETAPSERWDPAKHNQTEIGRIEPA